MRLAFFVFLLVVLGIELWPRYLFQHRCHGGCAQACKSNLKNIGTAIEMYSTDYNGHYPRNINMLTPNYLKTIPDCPRGKSSYRATFGPAIPSNPQGFEDYYLIECEGENHTDVGIQGDYPKYDGIWGLIERAYP